MSEAVLDVNVLIAAHLTNHAHHLKARKFVDSLAHFYTTPTTQGGLLRFLTRPWKNEKGDSRPPRMTPAEAFAVLANLTGQANHIFLPDDISIVSICQPEANGHSDF